MNIYTTINRSVQASIPMSRLRISYSPRDHDTGLHQDAINFIEDAMWDVPFPLLSVRHTIKVHMGYPIGGVEGVLVSQTQVPWNPEVVEQFKKESKEQGRFREEAYRLS